MKQSTRQRTGETGLYRTGYAVIAGAMALALMATLPFAASSISRTASLIVTPFSGGE